MARILNLVSWFLLGSSSFTFLGWVGFLDPTTRLLSGVIFLLCSTLYLAAWICDDAIARYLRVDELRYKGALLALGICAVLGLITALLIERFSWTPTIPG